MNEKTLRALIQQGEGQTLEFKLRPSEDMGRTLCAFANTNDGMILVGISDSKEFVGTSQKMESQIASIAHSCKPSIFPKITAIEIGGKTVLSVEVRKTGGIHSDRNIAYRRVGSHDSTFAVVKTNKKARILGGH